jgi:hypothetical protein
MLSSHEEPHTPPKEASRVARYRTPSGQTLCLSQILQKRAPMVRGKNFPVAFWVPEGVE